MVKLLSTVVECGIFRLGNRFVDKATQSPATLWLCARNVDLCKRSYEIIVVSTLYRAHSLYRIFFIKLRRLFARS